MRFLILIVIIALGVTAYFFLHPSHKSRGDSVENFTVDTMNRRAFSFDKLEGKVKCIFFFSVNDEDSQKMLTMARFAASPFATDSDVKFLGIATDGDADRVKLFMSQFKFPGDVLMDSEGVIAKEFEVNETPSVFVVDRTNTIQYVRSGWIQDFIREVIPAIREAK